MKSLVAYTLDNSILHESCFLGKSRIKEEKEEKQDCLQFLHLSNIFRLIRDCEFHGHEYMFAVFSLNCKGYRSVHNREKMFLKQISDKMV